MSAKHNNKYVKYTPHERFMLSTYREMDKEITKQLERFKIEGIIPSCKKGCYFCCRQEVPTVIPEAHAMGQYIRRNFSEKQKNELRKRTFDWFEWVKNELPKYGNTPEEERAAFYNYAPYCPLLVNGECSIYPVRPVACRTHYVSSNPDSCRSYTDPNSEQDEPTMLLAIPNATKPFAMRIRESIEATGVNFDDATLLLPQWLAVELGWKDLLP